MYNNEQRRQQTNLLASSLLWMPQDLNPAACIRARNPKETSASEATLPTQIKISQDHCFNGCFMPGLVSVTFSMDPPFLPLHRHIRWRGGESASVIRFSGFHLAAEHVVAPVGVHQNKRDDEQGPDQHESKALRWCGGFPDADLRRNDIRPQADP